MLYTYVAIICNGNVRPVRPARPVRPVTTDFIHSVWLRFLIYCIVCFGISIVTTLDVISFIVFSYLHESFCSFVLMFVVLVLSVCFQCASMYVCPLSN